MGQSSPSSGYLPDKKSDGKMESPKDSACENLTLNDLMKKLSEEFNADFLDESVCRRWILKNLHPTDPACPCCSAAIRNEGQLQRFWSGRRLRCQLCGKYFSAFTDTILSGAHIGIRKIVLIALLLDLDVSSRRIADILGINQETVRLWRRRFQEK